MKKLLILTVIVFTILFSSDDTKQTDSSFKQTILKASSDSYTIYLASIKSAEKSQEFILKHQIEKNSVAFKFGADEQWYKVFHGVYTTRDEAISALGSLDENLQKNNPLIQKIKRIQASYDKFYNFIDVNDSKKEIIVDTVKFRDKILSASSESYTISLASVPDIEASNLFIIKNDLQTNSVALKFGFEKEWYKIYYGVYKTRDSANNEIEGLSEKLQKNKPVIRKVIKVQELYKKFYSVEKKLDNTTIVKEMVTVEDINNTQQSLIVKEEVIAKVELETTDTNLTKEIVKEEVITKIELETTDSNLTKEIVKEDVNFDYKKIIIVENSEKITKPKVETKKIVKALPTITEDEKIKTINFEPQDKKSIASRFIESELIDNINQNRIYTKRASHIDILDNIIYSKDSNFKNNLDNNFTKEKYDLNILNISSKGSLDVINKLQDSKINIGLSRGDVLGIHNNGLYNFEPFQNYGILCAPHNSILYIVSKSKINSIYDLRGKKVSTGNISNFAQVYLNDIVQNIGMSADISFRSYNMAKSIQKLKSDKIDVVFIFGLENQKTEILKHGLIISSIPRDAVGFLKKRKGLISYNYKIKDKVINTFTTPNYLIAPLETLDIDINKKIEAMVDKFECYKNIQNIDPFYGKIHPEVKNAIANIRANNKKVDDLNNQKNAIIIKLDSQKEANNKTQYIYKVYNDSKFDSNITFDYYKTKLFDNTAIKARHVLDNFPKGIIQVKAKTQKLISFTYENGFTTKVKDTKINLIFKDMVNKDNTISTVLNIGDK